MCENGGGDTSSLRMKEYGERHKIRKEKKGEITKRGHYLQFKLKNCPNISICIAFAPRKKSWVGALERIRCFIVLIAT